MRTRAFTFSSDPMPADSHERGGHRSVLLEEAIHGLSIREGDIVVDATLGESGHAKRIINALGAKGALIGFDADRDAADMARERLSGSTAEVHIVQANFRFLETEVRALGVTHISKALFDLGWNTGQLAAGRGFSFQKDEPLLMTYEKEPKSGAVTAERVVNTWAEESLIDIFFGFGEERFARKIAKAIVERREEKPFTSAKELGEFLKQIVPGGKKRKVHPATKVFQALRMAVNDELGAITEGLSGAWRLLEKGGVIAVITFHSVEDRHVKRFFQDLEKKGEGKRVTKKPLTPSVEEIKANPRSRSAKLRIFEKL